MMLLAVTLVPLSACSLPSPQAEFDQVARRTIDQLDAEDYGAIFAQAAEAFREGPGGSAGFAAAMDNNHKRLGRCGAPVRIGKTRIIPTKYGFVSVQDYRRLCANGPANIELSTVRTRNGARLIGLHVSSPAFSQTDPMATVPQ